MHKVIFGIGGFALGAVTGILVSKKYFEDLADAEIEEVKEYFENKQMNDRYKKIGKMADKYNRDQDAVDAAVMSFVANEEKLKKGGTNYAEMFKKPSLDELVVGLDEEDEIGEKGTETSEKTEKERFEILEDTAAVAKNASIIELYYSEFNNRFEEENGDEVDIKYLVGETAVARFVMGEDEMSVYDNELEVLYELSRYDPVYDASAEDRILTKVVSPRERREQNA